MTQENPSWAMTTTEKEERGTAHYINELFVKRKEEFEAALKESMTPEFFRRLLMTAFNGSPKLLSCTQDSIYQSALEIAQLQLEPNTALDEAFLIPYGKKCTVQIGRNGWVKLAFRTGLVSDVNALPVYRGEEFVWQPGQEPEIIHKPDIDIGSDAELLTGYAWVDMKDGRRIYEVLRRFEWERSRDKALKRGNSFGWSDYPERMICRTALSRLIRTRLPVNEYMGNSEVYQSEAIDPSVQASKAKDAAKRVQEKVIDLSHVEVNEETGEVIELPQAKEQHKPDGASKGSAARGTPTNSTKLTAAKFWKELSLSSKFWKVPYSKDQVIALAEKEYSKDQVGALTTDERHSLLTLIEAEMKRTNEGADDDNITY